jgi:UDP-N-acetyl-D-glucosamine dehydrogenase
LSHRKEIDFHTRFIELAGEVNLAMPYHFVNSVAQGLNKKVLSYVTLSVTHLG